MTEKKEFDLEQVKAEVLASLPLLNDLKDQELKAKIVEAWAYSLTQNGWFSLRDMPGNGQPEWDAMGTQADHLLGVARLSLAIADIIESQHGAALNIDRDLLLACGLCHDLGKPFEYRPENRERWKADPRVSGLPALRHTLYGVHVALTFDLPEVMVHTAGCHSREGEFVYRSLITEIVHCADETWWKVLENANGWQIPWTAKGK